MAEDMAAYDATMETIKNRSGQGRYCGNCGIRVDGLCTLTREDQEHCMATPGRPHWRKLIENEYINPVTFHARTCRCDACVEYWESMQVEPDRVEKQDTIKKNNHTVDVDEMVKYDPKSRYYDHGGIEVLEIIKAKLTPEQYQGFCLGNAIKYTCRANHKGDYDRDMEKAEFYAREAR
jgi:hypothetical protein